MRRVGLVLVVLVVVGVALAGEAPSVTQPIIDAIDGAGDGILGPIGALLGVLVTVGIGFAIVKTIRG